MKASVCGLEVFRFRSRIIKAVYYHPPTRRMVIHTAHGKFLIYSEIDRDLPHVLRDHPAPGMIFDQSLRMALRSRRASMLSLSNVFLLRQVRLLAKAHGKATQAIQQSVDHRP